MLREIHFSYKTFAIPNSISEDKFNLLKEQYQCNNRYKFIKYNILKLYPHHAIGLLSFAISLGLFFVSIIVILIAAWLKIDLLLFLENIFGSTLIQIFEFILTIPIYLTGAYFVLMILSFKLGQAQNVLDVWIDSIYAEKDLKKTIMGSNNYTAFSSKYLMLKRRYSNYSNKFWDLC